MKKQYNILVIIACLVSAFSLSAQKNVRIKYNPADKKGSNKEVFKIIYKAIMNLNTSKEIVYLHDMEAGASEKNRYSFYGVLTFKEEDVSNKNRLEVKIHFVNPGSNPDTLFREFDISGLFAKNDYNSWNAWATGVANDIKELYVTQKRMSTIYVKILSPESICDDIQLENNIDNIKVYYYKYSSPREYCENAKEQYDILWCEAAGTKGKIKQSLHRNSLIEYKTVSGADLDETKKKITDEYLTFLKQQREKIYGKGGKVIFLNTPKPVAIGTAAPKK